jgi:ABC-type dipeptide/oligopeptide/nickel transport system permease component
MLQFLTRRLSQALIVVVAVSAVIFFVMRLLPGDPARLMAPRASPEALAALHEQLGLDKPQFIQFMVFLSNAIRGDLGESYYEQTPALGLILERLPLTMLLAGLAMVIAVGLGLPLGFLAATRRGTAIDRGILVLQMFFQSAPSFWLALVLLLVFGVNLQWVQPIGYEGLQSAILPAIAMAVGLIAIISRSSRSSMMEILQLDWVKALHARGISRRRVVWLHAFKNTWVSTLTLLGAQVGYLLGGAVVVEWIFNYPGVGLLTLNAVLRKDYPLVQAIVIVTATIFVLVNLLIDISYGMIDPRVRRRA